MNLNILKYSAFVLITTSMTCSAQKELAPLSKEYQSCCGTQPVEFALEEKKVYMPNVFTPNNDGVNDYFSPFFNEVVTAVWGFTIYSAKGDTIIYQKPFLSSKMDVKEYGWDGNREDGTPYTGLFRFKMRVDDRYANKHIVEGFACAIRCEAGTAVLKTKEGCYYPSQASKGGTLSKSQPNREKDCLQ